MCGIFASVGLKWPADEINLPSPIELLSHRGPDNRQLLEFDNIFIGHTRLSIIDGSSSSNQPFISPDKQDVFIINGEVTNYRSLNKAFGLGVPYWQSDSKVAFELIRKIGFHKALSNMYGMFAGIFLSRRSNKLYLFRDRFGVKPLFYNLTPDSFLCASEISPILRMMPRISVNYSAIRDYLLDGLMDHSSSTFFQDIKVVMPGSLFTYDLEDSSLKSEQWYFVNPSRSVISDSNGVEEKLEGLLTEVIDEYVQSDVPVGINLSDGVDSSLLASLVSKRVSSLSAYTLDFSLGKETAEAFQLQEHLVIRTLIKYSSDIFFKHLKDLVRHQGQPFSGLFLTGYSELYTRARQHGTVVLLDGNGLDEFFLGYNKYLSPHHNRYVDLSGNTAYNPQIYSEDLYGISPLERTSAPVASTSNVPSHFSRALDDIFSLKIPRSLRFNDHVSMQHGCELRVPFLDHRLLEYSLSLSNNELVDTNLALGKMPIRRLLSRSLSHQFCFSSKRDVQTLQSSMLTGELHDFVCDVLLSSSFLDRGLVDSSVFVKHLTSLKNKALPHSFYLWRLVSLELWFTTFCDYI
jgi:asparagine synthase (glutamine-hydrolysing)